MADTKKPKGKKDKQPEVIISTPVGIAAYAYFMKADTEGQYADDKFKGQLVLDGDTDLSALEAKIKAFAAEVFAEDGAFDVDELKLPWGEGREDKEEFAGKIVLKASSKFKPKLVDTKRVDLPKSVKVLSGDKVRLVASLYAYKKTEKVKEGKKLIDVVIFGVSLQLMTVQLVEKRTGGGGNGGLDALDDIDGYEAPADSGADEGEDDEETGDGSEF